MRAPGTFDATFLVGYIRFGVWATRRTLKAMEFLSDEEFARDLKGPFGGIRGSRGEEPSSEVAHWRGLAQLRQDHDHPGGT